MNSMKLAEALDKIAALEKRIEELEKRQPVVINNYPPAYPWFTTNLPFVAPQPFTYGDPPHHGPTCGIIDCGGGITAQVNARSFEN